MLSWSAPERAGLAAALELAGRSLRVIVLEARDRVGGRVRWERAGSVDVPGGIGRRVYSWTGARNVGVHARRGLNGGRNRRRLVGVRTRRRLAARRRFFIGRSVPACRRTRRRRKRSRFLAPLRGRSEITRCGAAWRACSSKGSRRRIRGAPASRSIADELSSGVDDTSTRPVGSYAPLFADLQARCERAGIDMRLGVAVEQVVWQHGSVSVTTRTATLRARCAVITVPVGVLQQRAPATPFTFDPPLPAAKQAALRGLEMGQVVRVALAFRTPFWETLEGGRYRDAAFFSL